MRNAKSTLTLLGDIWDGLLDLVYPPKCLVCGQMQPEYLCEECRSEIVFIEPPTCARCGAPLEEGACSECRGTEFAFDSAQSVGVYDGALREAIHQLKYSGHKVLSPILGALLVDYLRPRSPLVGRIGCIVPVAIHPSRRRQRGFNQSELMAREISRCFGIPLLADVLVRSRPTRPQVELPVDRRRANVEGVFSVAREDAVAGRTVLLLDDVFTTGSTVDAAARSLRAAGASQVHVLTLARSV